MRSATHGNGREREVKEKERGKGTVGVDESTDVVKVRVVVGRGVDGEVDLL